MLKTVSVSLSLRFLLAMTWVACSIPAQGAGYPSDKQCRALRDQQNPLKPEVEGWCLMIERRKGNCLACHNVNISPWPDGLSAPGNTGPTLTGISGKFTDSTALNKFIHDPSSKNPGTIMPLFGKHRILTDEEIENIARFLMAI